MAVVSGGNIEVTYSRGWKEEIENGRYELKDPANRTVVQRPATARDRARLPGTGGSRPGQQAQELQGDEDPEAECEPAAAGAVVLVPLRDRKSVV